MEINSETRILVTGASAGIGAATAIELGRRGAKVAICARRRQRLEEVAGQVREAGGTALLIRADVSDKAQAEHAVQETIRRFGGIDVLLNNAGRGNMASVEDTTQQQIESMFALNVYALWYTCGIALPFMKKQGRGHIINIASVAGKMAFPYNSAYVAAKHACVGFTAGLRAELIGTGVEASVVCPAAVDTDWAGITEGGALGELFAAGIKKSRLIAEEFGLPLAPLGKYMPAAEVARKIVEIVENPQESDVFTHPESYEQAVETARDRKAMEKKMLPLFLGMQKSYAEMKLKS